MGFPLNKEMVRKVQALRKRKRPVSFRKIAAMLGSDLKTVYRWSKHDLRKKR